MAVEETGDRGPVSNVQAGERAAGNSLARGSGMRAPWNVRAAGDASAAKR